MKYAPSSHEGSRMACISLKPLIGASFICCGDLRGLSGTLLKRVPLQMTTGQAAGRRYRILMRFPLSRSAIAIITVVSLLVLVFLPACTLSGGRPANSKIRELIAEMEADIQHGSWDRAEDRTESLRKEWLKLRTRAKLLVEDFEVTAFDEHLERLESALRTRDNKGGLMEAASLRSIWDEMDPVL